MRRIIEIAENHRHLRAEHGFLVIEDRSQDSVELGRVPFGDIEAVITTGNGITYSNTALVRLVQNGSPLVLSDNAFQVQGILMSVESNSLQAHRFEHQISASKPTNKRAWAQLVRAKILQQASVLEAVGHSPKVLEALASKVTSGDKTNVEAQAARKYWRALFGPQFRRERFGAPPNGFLNYGYTILRAATIRSILASGLHPSIGVSHSNDANAFRLADDLIEPFRPFIDLQVWELYTAGLVELDTQSKTKLVEVLAHDLRTTNGVSPLGVCIQKLAMSLVNVYLGERTTLSIPPPQISQEVEAPSPATSPGQSDPFA
jgi:CRISPR-associated protein Cas1